MAVGGDTWRPHKERQLESDPDVAHQQLLIDDPFEDGGDTEEEPFGLSGSQPCFNWSCRLKRMWSNTWCGHEGQGEAGGCHKENRSKNEK